MVTPIFVNSKSKLTAAAPPFIFIADDHGIESALANMNQPAHLAGARKLVFCTGESPSAWLAAEISAIAVSANSAEIVIHHDHGDPAQGFDFWPLFETPSAAQVFCFGEQTLLDAISDMSGHWPSGNIHLNLLAATALPSAAPTTALSPAAPDVQDQPFTILLDRSGQKIVVLADQSILQALRAHGHPVPSSCESGSCGTCRTGLISGEADHRDWVLFEDEQAGNIMLCVSRAKSAELVLDL